MGVCRVIPSLIPLTFIQRLLVLEAYVISFKLFYYTFALGDMFVYYHIGLSLIVLFSLCAKKNKKEKKEKRKKIIVHVYVFSISIP